MRDSAAHDPNTLAPALGAMNDPEPTCGTLPLERLVAARFRSDHDECGCTRLGLIVDTEEPCPPYGISRSPGFIPSASPPATSDGHIGPVQAAGFIVRPSTRAAWFLPIRLQGGLSPPALPPAGQLLCNPERISAMRGRSSPPFMTAECEPISVRIDVIVKSVGLTPYD